MTPEERARVEIDRQLEHCGWVVQDRAEMDIYAAPGVAVREFPLQGGEEADYLLYAYGQAIGVVEAKPEGFTLHGVETQSARYARGLSPDVPAYRLPLPFLYESTGDVTQFTNGLDPDPRSREVFTFHRPDELLRLVESGRQLRGGLQELPPLNTAGLWPAQVTAIENLEQSLRANRPRTLIQMATGSGKTFTAVSAIYRLVKYAGARRVLFLVDRANLGRQTHSEFQQYVSPYNGLTFTDEYDAAYAYVHRAAHLLANHEGRAAAAVRHDYEEVLDAMTQPDDLLLPLADALAHFEKVTRSYWPGLFHCYDVEGLPATNNELEQYFGSAHYHERRATGRRGASPGLVARGPVRVLAAVATQGRRFAAADLRPAQPGAWERLRARLSVRREMRRHQSRFRKDPAAYLAALEARLLKPPLPS